MNRNLLKTLNGPRHLIRRIRPLQILWLMDEEIQAWCMDALKT